MRWMKKFKEALSGYVSKRKQEQKMARMTQAERGNFCFTVTLQ